MKRHTVLLLLWTAFSAGLVPVKADNVLPEDTIKVVDIEEVVVIATPKENERLRRQPVAATSFSQADMQSGSVTSVKALSSLVPNLFIPDYGSKLTTSVYVRGIGSRINTPAVGLYVDNIPFIDKSAFDFNYSDIERIDVLRGPQGTLYGRNTMGGLIRVFTKSPFTYQGTDVRLSGAVYNDYRASLTHYHRISEQFAFSVGLFYRHDGGFFKNAYNGERIDRNDEFGGRIRAIYLPKENLKLDFTVNYEYNNQGGYPYAYTGLVSGTEDRGDYVGRISYNHVCGYKRNLLNSGLNVERHADNFILNSVTGFQYLRDHMDMDQDFTEQDIYTLVQKQNSKTLSQEIVLKARPGRRWQWTTGVSGFYQWLFTEAPVTFCEDGVKTMVEDNVNEVFAGLKAGNPRMPDMWLDVTDSRFTVSGQFSTPTVSAAVYHQSTVNDLFVEGLSLTAGLRLEYEKYWMTYDSGTQMGFDFNIRLPMATIPLRDMQISPLLRGKLNADNLQLLPKIALKYDFSPNTNIYASVTKGYRSGGYNVQMFSDLIQGVMTGQMIEAIDEKSGGMVTQMAGDMLPDSEVNIEETTTYRPEYSWNYEVGSHLTLFGGKLQADLAAFYMDTHDQQLSRFSERGMGRITVNAGKSRSVGAEVGIRAQVTEAFSLNGNYGYTYATFTDYVTNERTNGGMQEVNYNGHYVPFVPKHTFNVGGQYVFTLRSCDFLDNVTVDAHYKAAGRIYWTEKNNASQALYGTLSGRVSLNKGSGQISFWINNALNKDYQAFYFETMGRGFAQMGRPLQVGVDIRCRF